MLLRRQRTLGLVPIHARTRLHTDSGRRTLGSTREYAQQVRVLLLPHLHLDRVKGGPAGHTRNWPPSVRPGGGPESQVVLLVRRRAQAGFTLIELLVVIAILGILAAILIPNFIRSRASAFLATCQLDLRNIAATLDLFYNEHQVYPNAGSWISDLESGGYIRAVPRSPIDKAAYAYATDASRTTYVLSDGPDKYLQSGVSGYVVYAPAGGLSVGVPTVPSP